MNATATLTTACFPDASIVTAPAPMPTTFDAAPPEPGVTVNDTELTVVPAGSVVAIWVFDSVW
jgi:hypothetical protein